MDMTHPPLLRWDRTTWEEKHGGEWPDCFARRLNRARLAKGWDYIGLTARAGIMPQALYDLENPEIKRKKPGKNIRKVAAALGVSVEYLMTGSD
jgi:transcriptional regulator with XRE-family HTH domain